MCHAIKQNNYYFWNHYSKMCKKQEMDSIQKIMMHSSIILDRKTSEIVNNLCEWLYRKHWKVKKVAYFEKKKQLVQVLQQHSEAWMHSFICIFLNNSPKSSLTAHCIYHSTDIASFASNTQLLNCSGFGTWKFSVKVLTFHLTWILGILLLF